MKIFLKEVIIAKNHEFLTKSLWKAIMTRCRLKNVYLTNQNTTNCKNYNYQRNICTKLLRNNNKKFCKKIKPFFSDKSLAGINIVLKEKGNLITDNQKLANLFNAYFINITDTLKQKNSPLKLQYLSEITSFY